MLLEYYFDLIFISPFYENNQIHIWTWTDVLKGKQKPIKDKKMKNSDRSFVKNYYLTNVFTVYFNLENLMLFQTISSIYLMFYLKKSFSKLQLFWRYDETKKRDEEKK